MKTYLKSHLSDARIKACQDDRFSMQDKFFSESLQQVGEVCVNKLRQLYAIYDENIYIWLSRLWEPDIGGFYFSESARDSHGFLPDIESTVGALHFIEPCGLNSSRPGKRNIDALPEQMRKKLIEFTKGLQDAEDGYFYHSQWGKRILVSRRGRDLGWATSLLRELSDFPLYPTPLDKSDNGEKSSSLPEHLSSLKAFREYLSGLNFQSQSYWNGNLLQSQQRQIQAAGNDFVDLMFSHLESIQREDNGLWEPQVNYASVNGLMKINLMYMYFGRPLPYADIALKNSLNVALSNEKILYCTQFYNPLVTIGQILNNIKKFDGESRSDALRSVIKERTDELIDTTIKKVKPCRRDDGAFSYFYDKGCDASQGAPVSLGVLESDVNATGITSWGIAHHLCSIFDIPSVPMFGAEDSALFYDLIENANSFPKVNQKPDWFDSKLV